MNTNESLLSKKNDVYNGIVIRYVLNLSAILILFFLRNFLPFPYPDLMIVSVVAIILNCGIHLLSINGKLIPRLYLLLAIIDILLVPFTTHYSGGFLSPFIFVSFVSAMGSSIILSSKKTGLSLIGFIVASYVAVSLMQKFGILQNAVPYSQSMMNNDTFFYFVLFTIASVFFSGYGAISGMVRKQAEQLSDAYQMVLQGTTVTNKERFFPMIIQNIRTLTNAQCAFISTFEPESRLFTVVCGSDGDHESSGSPVANNPVFEKTIKSDGIVFHDDNFQREYIKATGCQGPSSGHYAGVTLIDSENEPLGILFVIHASKKGDWIIHDRLLKIFATRIGAELERAFTEDINRKLQENLLQSQKLEAVGKLAGGIAHDFNNILNAILGFASILKRKMPDDSPLKHYPDKILSASQAAADLTKQLLTYARKGKLQSVPFNLHQSIEDVTMMLSHTINKNIKIELSLNSPFSHLSGDPVQIQSMLLNLCINGRDAMPDGGTLFIETTAVHFHESPDKNSANEKIPTHICLLIRDTGTGIKKEDVPYIFEPFFTTKGTGKGTGLGLASVYGCTKQHGGTITVESEPDKGTTFKVLLPLYFGKVSDETTKSAEIKMDKRYRLMLVDDETIICESLGEALTGHGFDVVTFSSGEKAIEWFRNNSDAVDLVVLDMIMPEMNGKEVFVRLKEIRRDFKVVFLSGYGLDEEADYLYKEGVQALISKPITIENFLNITKSILTKNSK